MFHHITAICSNPISNIEFYKGLLGMRLVKVTVNFDDPQSYHLYYGDSNGSPGTLLTFFVWPHLSYGREGYGLWGRIILSVPPGSLGYWKKRLKENDIEYEDSFIEEKSALLFYDNDGTSLGLIEEDAKPDYYDNGIGIEHSIIRIIGMEMILKGNGDDIELLSHMGYQIEEDIISNMSSGDEVHVYAKDYSFVIIRLSPDKGTMGMGSVHHTAFRIDDDKEQEEKRKLLQKYEPSPIIDRIYFKSVYIASPQRLIFEIATIGPGMRVDEKVLGSSLKLPPWYEPQRKAIVESLEDLDNINFNQG
ncbi:MAG: ring-cleaving dioxygenase [Candidatus Woesearchaeota archaeon]